MKMLPSINYKISQINYFHPHKKFQYLSLQHISLTSKQTKKNPVLQSPHLPQMKVFTMQK